MSDTKKIPKPESDSPLVSILDKLRLDLNNWDRELTDAEIQYMFERFTHIQVATPNNPKLPTYSPPKITHSQSGWAIINYGNAISSSPGEYLFNYAGLPQYHAMKKAKGEDDDGGDDGTGIGTIHKQRFDTAEDIVKEALKNGWESIHVVDGDPNFIWALWVHAEKNGLSVTGYDFNESEQQRKERVYRKELAEQVSRKSFKR